MLVVTLIVSAHAVRADARRLSKWAFIGSASTLAHVPSGKLPSLFIYFFLALQC